MFICGKLTKVLNLLSPFTCFVSPISFPTDSHTSVKKLLHHIDSISSSPHPSKPPSFGYVDNLDSMGSNWKKKGGKKAKSKTKAKKKLQESSEKSDEFPPFTEAEQRLLDAWSKDDKVMRSTEFDYEIGWDSDEAYMLALTGNINLSEETMRQLHEAKSERFKYFIEYGMFEEEWLQLKKKYPDEFVGEFPSKEHECLPVILMLNDTEKPVPISTSSSRSTGEFPRNELDAKPESLLKESPTVTSDSGIAVCTKTHVLVEEDTEKAVAISTSGSGSTCGFPHNAKPEPLVKESPTETCHIGIVAEHEPPSWQVAI